MIACAKNVWRKSMESKTQTVLPLRVIARRHDEAIQATITYLDCFVPRSDAKRRVFCCMWVLCLMLLFVACAPKERKGLWLSDGGDLPLGYHLVVGKVRLGQGYGSHG